jgi:glycosyltransferase involved in cell wall biosynthesis
VTARNVVLVANNVDELGGVQRVARLLAAGLAGRGHRVELVGITHAPRAPGVPAAEGYTESTMYSRGGPGRAFRPRTLRQALSPRGYAAEVRRRVRRRRAGAAMSARLQARGEGILVVMQVYAMEQLAGVDLSGYLVVGQYHDSYAAAKASTHHRRMLSAYADVDRFLLLTPHDAAQFEKDGMTNVGWMRNPLSFYPDEPAPLTDKVVVAAARYDHQKGLDRLVEAWALVAPHHPDWVLKVFGSGPLEKELRAQVAALGLTESFLLMGPTADMERELRRASVYALSSRHEGLPMVLAEAMACGVPCVAFDCAPGIREIVTDGLDGLVVPPGDVPALAAGLRRLMEDEATRRRFGAAARTSVRRFDLEGVLDDWEQLFVTLER